MCLFGALLNYSMNPTKGPTEGIMQERLTFLRVMTQLMMSHWSAQLGYYVVCTLV